MKRSLITALLSVITSAAAAQETPKEPNNIAVVTCRNAAKDVLQSIARQSDSIRFAPVPRVSQKPGKMVVVEDAGAYQYRVGSRWLSFTYDCKYDTAAEETSNVKMRFGANGAVAQGSPRR